MSPAAEKLIEAVAQALVAHDENREGVWPEYEGDIGRREYPYRTGQDAGSPVEMRVGWVAILSPEDMDNYRAMAKAAIYAAADFVA